MSILNDTTLSEENSAAKKAARIKFLNKVIADEIIKSWNKGWDMIWDDANPQAVLDALGEDAAEVFEINEHTVAFMVGVLGGRRQAELDAILAKVTVKPETQTDENGNVTII